MAKPKGTKANYITQRHSDSSIRIANIWRPGSVVDYTYTYVISQETAEAHGNLLGESLTFCVQVFTEGSYHIGLLPSADS